jgi:prepilin-type N-terminal cleavage/methylation domain-containing protein
MKANRFQRRAAFTLVEILMAMAIFAMVLTAIYATWTLILRGSRVGLEAAAQVQRERVAINTIEQALTASFACQADARQIQYYGIVAESGSQARLSFVARLPKSFPRSGRFGDLDVRRVEFAVEPGPESSKQLVLRQCPTLMDFDEDEKNHPLVLARNVKELLLDYWDEKGGQAEPWTDDWAKTSTNQLPKMVRITLKLETPASRYSSSPAKEDEVTRVVLLASTGVPLNLRRSNPGGGPPAGGQGGKVIQGKP